jgi:hypothetical protein
MRLSFFNAKELPMHFIALTLVVLLTLPLPARTQEAPPTQPATADAPLTITFDAIRLTHTGFIATVSYINTLAESLQLTLTYPQEKSGFAADNFGNEYTLTNATGMTRLHNDPNRDIAYPANTSDHSIFLLAPPRTRATASYQFKRAGGNPQATDKPTSFMISLGLYARPAKDFKPAQEPQRGFTFTATITDAKPE